jgi:tRNA 2-thiouridine synthesizing protein E
MISGDQALAAHVMRVAKSAIYQPRHPIESLQHAISWLGMAVVSDIAFTVAVPGKLLNVPEEYAILFLQGGASLPVAMVPMNLLGPGQTADYINSGAWAAKAINEAKLMGTVNVAARRWDQPLRKSGFVMSGHQGPSLTLLQRAFVGFRLEARLRLRGTARLLVDYDGVLGPNVPQSDATLHPLALSRCDAVELSEGHWKVIRFLRTYYLQFGIAPMIRKLCKETGFQLKYIYQLFPTGPAKGACKLAGLPKPTGCV